MAQIPTGAQLISTTGASNIIDATNPAYGLSVVGTAAANAAALASADAAAVSAGKILWIPKGTYLSNSVTFSAMVTMYTGAILSSSSATFVFSGGVDFNIAQHLALTGTATATFNKAKTLVGYAEWFGAISLNPAVDCAVPINQAIIALDKVQLMPTDYYTNSQITHRTHGTSVVGAKPMSGWNIYSLRSGGVDLHPDNATRIFCQSASATMFDISGGLTTTPAVYTNGSYLIADFMVERIVAPSIASNCIGVRVEAWAGEIRNVYSCESMRNWVYEGSVLQQTFGCRSYRSMNGSGAGTDFNYGFWFNGRGKDTTVAQWYKGNASCYFRDSYAESGGAFKTTSFASSSIANVGYHWEPGYLDFFGENLEAGWVKRGFEIIGTGSTAVSPGLYLITDQDFKIRNAVLECLDEHIYITGTHPGGSIVITGGYSGAGGGTRSATAPSIYITDSYAKVKIRDFQQHAAQPSGAPNVRLFNVSNVDILDLDIDATSATNIIDVIGANLCRITARMKNAGYAAGKVNLSGSDRNYLAVAMDASNGGSFTNGYVLDSTSNFNELNCTLLNPAAITGGAANKFVENGVQITAIGLTAGSNLASGVMA